MNVIYLDCSSGISGDMFLGAFVDAGFKLNDLKRALSKLNLKGYRISAKEVKRHHINATKICIETVKERQIGFKPTEIEGIIKKSSLHPKTKEMAMKIFQRLCAAERKVHKERKIHLHELGHIDTVLDIVGAAICLSMWKIEKIYFSNITFGQGVLKRRIPLPIPSPATLELLKGIPSRFSNIGKELITPTGAAILRTVGTSCPGNGPTLKVKEIGYGAGTRNIEELPNTLRLVFGEEIPQYLRDSVTVIETAVDDTMPIMYTYLYERLFAIGALDVYVTNISMKKQRPAALLTAVIPDELLKETAEVIFRETGTIGIRYYRTDRLKLQRVSRDVKTKYGSIKVKMSGANGEIYKVSPEFESCRSIASKNKVPLSKVYEAAKKTISILLLCVFLDISAVFCDTVYLNNGREVKGIVVEEYNDRVVLSTEFGERQIMKDKINRVLYDLPEQNMVAMADKYMEKHDYDRAYYYYEKARGMNPDNKEAIEGVNYLNSYMLRKNSARKAQHVRWRQDVENFRENKPVSHEPNELRLIRIVGITLQEVKKKGIIVTKVYAGTPAAIAGMKKGDLLSSIWGELTKYLSKDDAVDRLIKPELMEIQIQIDRYMDSTPDAIQPSQLELTFNGLILKNISEKTKAYKAGLRDGDLILSINYANIRYTPLNEVMQLIKKDPTRINIRRDLTIWRKIEG